MNFRSIFKSNGSLGGLIRLFSVPVIIIRLKLTGPDTSYGCILYYAYHDSSSVLGLLKFTISLLTLWVDLKFIAL